MLPIPTFAGRLAPVRGAAPQTFRGRITLPGPAPAPVPLAPATKIAARSRMP